MLHIQLYRARRDHARLGHLIEVEQGSRRPDPFRLAELKKRKLAARDRIAALEARQDSPARRPQTA
ncbi:YdcH family protein [Brevundimonas sp.]|uniref:YdcH family protein n=1 Tax=Brevundimonas sp. TaxID=1871086 RepID=UPI002EDAC468